MVSDQRFSLRWNNYQSQLVRAFENLLDQEDLVDVTLGAEGRKLSAHKLLLSACSPYFRDLLKVSFVRSELIDQHLSAGQSLSTSDNNPA